MDKRNIDNLLLENLVVPEIQREYVWGGTRNRKVLEQFLQDLGQKLGSKGEANIGFLYSYKSGSEHYLIDGQQRFTTILLLLFYLSVKEGTHKEFVRRLRLDDSLQAFSYRVRSHTESFLQNLLKNAATNSRNIRDQKWFKSEYRGDPTIDAMLGALDAFKEIVLSAASITYNGIMEKVFFWYFDVEKTSQGEELYITMNSRGEKLTDSEQIKPRLFRKEAETAKKMYFGKKWDEWEEFFYRKELRLFYKKGFRKDRGIGTIDTAMNNIIRIVLELKTGREHSSIKPVEDAEEISLGDIETYMDAIRELSGKSGGKYIEEVTRLYGDSPSDANFYVLKALLIEVVKGQEDDYEYERVYQTILNQVRRNKLNNLPFLEFLHAYAGSPSAFYQFVEENQEGVCKKVIDGHELDKVMICIAHGKDAEEAIWKEQESEFWNGDIRQLIAWSKEEAAFSLKEFKRISGNFNLLFDQNGNAGWTSDSVRQAMITQRMPYYPYGNGVFGHSPEEWKSIIQANQAEFLRFINLFDDMDARQRDEKILSMKDSYVENEENEWAEFVQHDYLLAYCNKKHVQYRQEYGLECVENQYKRPFSVKNMHLDEYLKRHKNDYAPWKHWVDKGGWKSVVKLYRDLCPLKVWIQYRKDRDGQYEITLLTDSHSFSESEKASLRSAGFILEDGVFHAYAPEDLDRLMDFVKTCLATLDGIAANIDNKLG